MLTKGAHVLAPKHPTWQMARATVVAVSGDWALVVFDTDRTDAIVEIAKLKEHQ